MKERLRVLIVDDSTLVRAALREMLESDSDIQVVGEAANGREALVRAAELRPNIITMDVRMPIMDGLETTEQLMAYNPTPILAITALYARDDVDISFKMLGAGALEVMEKPDISDPAAYERARSELIRRVKLLARVRVVTHLRGRRRTDSGDKNEDVPWRVTRSPKPPQSSATEALAPGRITRLREQPANAPPMFSRAPRSSEPPPASADGNTPIIPAVPVAPAIPSVALPAASTQLPRARLRFPVVVIGASTGGPRIVQQILHALPETFDAAVLVVQHIAEGFSTGMVEWLATNCSLPVKLAAEHDRIQRGIILVAPDSFHLFVEPDGRIHLDVQPMLQRPSVDIAMQTAASVFGTYTTGVLLTGMGRDGAIGMQHIRQAGGYTIAQDEASCSIYGMPRAAVELDVVDDILSPEGVIQTLISRFDRSTTNAKT